jgi:hypothetical protein
MLSMPRKKKIINFLKINNKKNGVASHAHFQNGVAETNPKCLGVSTIPVWPKRTLYIYIFLWPFGVANYPNFLFFKFYFILFFL